VPRRRDHHRAREETAREARTHARSAQRPADPRRLEGKNFLEPVYPSTEKLKLRGLGGRQLARLTQTLLGLLKEKDLPENLPDSVLVYPDPATGQPRKFLSRYEAYQQIHFPTHPDLFRQAVFRLKFEEFFVAQLRLGLIKSRRHRYSQGVVFAQVGELFNGFYTQYLPFELTGAQKRVLKEIRRDAGSGRQMNRLLQGDVGSGKTIVALLAMLLAIDNGFQACLMAPTEILSRQHYEGISGLLKELPLKVRLLTGSSKSKQRKETLAAAADGTYRVMVRDLFNESGDDPSRIYRLAVRPERPDFRLVAMAVAPPAAAKDSKEVPVWNTLLRRGGTMPIRVLVHRRDGFGGEIKLETRGLPPGVTAAAAKIDAGANSGILLLSAAENAANWAGAISIVGTATISGTEVLREARGASVVRTVADPANEMVFSRMTRASCHSPWYSY